MNQRKIVSYEVVCCSYYNVKEFSRLVNLKINEDYQPYGSAFCDCDAYSNGTAFLYQPMIKYED